MDNDVIARFYPIDNEEATCLVQESTHCEAVLQPGLPAPGASASSHQHAFVLRFSRPPLWERGFVFGRDTKVCDCVLPTFHGIGNMHFAVTYDKSHHLVLEDFSKAGDHSHI